MATIITSVQLFKCVVKDAQSKLLDKYIQTVNLEGHTKSVLSSVVLAISTGCHTHIGTE